MIITAPSASPDTSKSPWKEMGGLPTANELAMIAATLARNIEFKPKELVEAAMQLLLAARQRIWFCYDENDLEMQDSNLEDYNWQRDYVPVKSFFGHVSKEQPVTRDQFLRKLLPQYKSRSADLARIAKSWIKFVLEQRSGKVPTQDEIVAAYARWKPYEDSNKAERMADSFKLWYEWKKFEARRIAGLASVMKRKASKMAGIKPKRQAKKAPSKKTERKSLDAF